MFELLLIQKLKTMITADNKKITLITLFTKTESLEFKLNS